MMVRVFICIKENKTAEVDSYLASDKISSELLTVLHNYKCFQQKIRGLL